MPEDIFISYAHIDNQPFGDTSGWVDQLFERLKVRVSQMLGAETVIWWDKRLQGDQYFAGEIGTRLSSTLLLAPIVTPRYVRSEWCRGELREFCERAVAKVQIGNHAFIFKIEKTYVPQEQLPSELKGLLGYVFYQLDENDRPREFRTEISPNKDQRYWDKLDDLAWDLAQAIERLRIAADADAAAQVPAEVEESLPLEKKIYLAETTPDLYVERDQIRRELQQHNYYVLPDKPLPSSPGELSTAVRDYLSRCALSVHLIGGRFDPTVRDGEQPKTISGSGATSELIPLQVQLAGERALTDYKFTRLIWLPPGLQTEDPRQQEFIKQINTSVGSGSELLQTPLQELKLRIIERLTSAPETKIKPSDSFSIYLIYDQRDADRAMVIGNFLFDMGFEVVPPIFEGDSAEVAQYHRDNLLNCSAGLIYYGSANQMWLRSKIWDLQKAPGWGRESSMVTAVYISAPNTPDKERFRTREVTMVITNFGEFSPETLKPFLDAINQSFC